MRFAHGWCRYCWNGFVLFWFFLLPAILEWLWNMTIPEVFGLKEITYWQSFRLIIISGILMGGGSFIKLTGAL